MNNQKQIIAYLAPEIPALSATFVYNELLGMENRDVKVFPISVRRPDSLAQDMQELGGRVFYLYEQGALKALGMSYLQYFRHPLRYTRAKLALMGDLFRAGGPAGAIKLIYQFLFAACVARELERNACTHLHIHFAHVPTQIGMYASLMSGIPFTFTAHANDIFERAGLLPLKAKRAKYLVTISDFNRGFLTERGVAGDRIRLVRCGVKLRTDKLGEQPFPAVPVFGTLGRLVEKKGVDILIQALGDLKRKGYDFRFQLAGDGPEQEKLFALLKQEDLEERTETLGALTHDKVNGWLDGLDVFVLACRMDSNGDQDGIPVVLMEAMNAGLPAVSCRISGIPELIEDGVSGLLAEPGNVESLSAKLESLWQAPDSPRELARAGRERIAAEFEEDLNVGRLLDIIRE